MVHTEIKKQAQCRWCQKKKSKAWKEEKKLHHFLVYSLKTKDWRVWVSLKKWNKTSPAFSDFSLFLPYGTEQTFENKEEKSDCLLGFKIGVKVCLWIAWLYSLCQRYSDKEKWTWTQGGMALWTSHLLLPTINYEWVCSAASGWNIFKAP